MTLPPLPPSLQGFTKAKVDINELPKYAERVLKEIASILDISKHVTAEEIITLYREHPPRANAAKDGFIGDGDQDTDEYRDKAIYNHGATSTGPKAKHKFYLTDLHLGSELVKAIKGTVYELYSDEPGDEGRFTAILYRLLTECKGDIEATTEPLIGHLMPQVNAVGKRNKPILTVNGLDQKRTLM